MADKKSKGGAKESQRSWLSFARIFLLDFPYPEFFSRPFGLFPAPTNCPWVSEDVNELAVIVDLFPFYTSVDD